MIIIRNGEPSLCVVFSVFNFSDWFEMHTYDFVIGKIIAKLLWLKHFSSSLAVCILVSISNCAAAIWQKSFVLQNEMAISRILYLPSLLIVFLIFKIFDLPVTVKGWPCFVVSLMDGVPVRNIFLHLQSISYNILLDPKTSPNAIKICIIECQSIQQTLI